MMINRIRTGKRDLNFFIRFKVIVLVWRNTVISPLMIRKCDPEFLQVYIYDNDDSNKCIQY